MIYSNKRYLSLFCAMLCGLLLATSLYFQYIANTPPCLLCVLQRGVVICLGVLFALFSLFNPTRHWIKCTYGTLIMLISTFGLLLSGRHIWLHIYSDHTSTSTTCLPGLSYLLNNFSVMEIIEQIISQTNTCDKVTMLVLGVDLSVWLLFFFSFFLLAGLLQCLPTAKQLKLSLN